MHCGKSSIVIALFILSIYSDRSCFAQDDDPSDKGCSNAADIVFVLDESGSIWGPHFTKQLEFVEHVVDTFDVRPGRVHIGILTFGTKVRTIFHLGKHKSEDALKAAIKDIKQERGETYTHEALRRTRTEMFAPGYIRPGIPHIAIVITDGESNFPDQTAAEADLAHLDGIQIFAVGVGQQINKAELRSIASSEDLVFEVDNYGALDELRDKLAWKACHVTTLPPPTTTTQPPPPQMIEGCTESRQMDHIWSIPDLAGVEENNLALSLIGEVTAEMKISPIHVQVGLTPRVCQAGPAIRLKDYDTQEGFLEALARRQYNPDANTHAHIQYIRNQGLAEASGGRTDTAKFGVIIVDGRHGKNRERAINEAKKAKDAGIRLIVLGVGNGVDVSELNSIASSTSDVLTVSNYEELSTLKSDIISRLCHGLKPNAFKQRHLYIKRYFNAYED